MSENVVGARLRWAVRLAENVRIRDLGEDLDGDGVSFGP